ncbi:hypothetical protein [Rhodopirellula bahusiensis]|uniref:hypothetical protein n=1 Tax=Rhodopirellula bahusiensis TaxID=2014065 RepID=UPI0032666F4A
MIDQCRKAGFRKIVLRGDTDFSSTEHLDRWNEDGVKFILGFDASKTLTEIAENLDDTLPAETASKTFLTDATGESTCQARQREGSVRGGRRL